jgi:hypothetical protein
MQVDVHKVDLRLRAGEPAFGASQERSKRGYYMNSFRRSILKQTPLNMAPWNLGAELAFQKPMAFGRIDRTGDPTGPLLFHGRFQRIPL